MTALLLAACGSTPDPAPPSASTTAVHVGNRPPAAKDVIEAVLANARVALSISPTCRNVGTETSDMTIGRYLSGFMAEMSTAETSNWIETRVTEGTTAAGEPAWICEMTLRHRDSEDRWGWGVQFAARQSDGLVLPDSFTCTGAG
jgi:hypothetical protein